VQVNYLPAYRHPVFDSLQINPELFPNSERFYSSEISIPFHLNLTRFELEYIVEKIKDFGKTLQI
jgi:dTDP-4-amino-4,6-dideoxygalactose transaminase